MKFVLSAPLDYELEETFYSQLRADCPQADLREVRDPKSAVKDADVIYTDTWVSMGQEEEKARRVEIFRDYQVNDELLGWDETFEAHADTIFSEAENRLHFQRTLLDVFFTPKL